MPSTSHILVLLLLLASYALTDFSNPQAHEGALGARSDDVPDFSSDQVSASGWTIDKSSGPELGLPQASTPVIDSSSELPLGVVRIDCSGSNTDQIQLASKLKRSRTAHKREQTFCTNPQFQRSKPPSEPVPRNGRSQTKGPGSGEESGRPPRLPEPDPQALENLVTRVRGNLGKANGAVCLSSDPYYRVPICVPIAPLRFSPAAVVEPARLWISWDDCEALFEDLWCCSIAKERISIPESTLFSDQIVSEIAVEIKIQKSGVILSSQFTTRYRATGLICRLVRDPYGLNN